MKHGLSYRPEYSAWSNMINRCINPDCKEYKYYGGRGITVYTGWMNNPQSFINYIGPRPSAQHSIDRYPNNDGNYEPGNVRWATKKEQIDNRRRPFDTKGIGSNSGKWYAFTPSHPVSKKWKWIGQNYNTIELAIEARKTWISNNWPTYPNGKPLVDW